MSAVPRVISRTIPVLLNRWCSVQYSSTDYPQYKVRTDEDQSVKRKRLVYQSRKRGMLENGLLLSTFADRYLDSLDSVHLDQYDLLINQPSNDWELYYWVTGKEETPNHYDNETMDLLKKHARNEEKESRYSQPNLKTQ